MKMNDKMSARQYAELEDMILTWINRSCESDDWPSVIVGDRTHELMAEAARAVFDAVVEAQAYAKHEGYLKETA